MTEKAKSVGKAEKAEKVEKGEMAVKGEKAEKDEKADEAEKSENGEPVVHAPVSAAGRSADATFNGEIINFLSLVTQDSLSIKL